MAAQRDDREVGDTAKTVAQNFIRQYGRPKFLRLVEMLMANEPGPKVAHEFGVTRQRVHQWKTRLGDVRTTFQLHDAVVELMETSSARKRV